jgi:single-strand selective monofunctional uracil DNA glycosylase
MHTNNNESTALLAAAKKLREQADILTFSSPVEWVYNPLDYAWDPYKRYVEKFGNGPKKALFLGMNPGPWGMAQTGVPFGEIAHVRDWLKIEGPVGKPEREHPKRPIQGFDCPRSEVSGRRLWGFIAREFGEPRGFFSHHFVANYCPLVFMGETGKNITPNTLPKKERLALTEICDTHLQAVIEILEPELCIGIGGYAEKRFLSVLNGSVPTGRIPVGRILHPSPASPLANRGWDETVKTQLKEYGIL